MEKPLRNISWSGFRYMFYMVTPNETSFATVEEVPNYTEEAAPWFIVFIMLEILYSTYKKKDYYRTNDALTSIHSGMMQQTVKILLFGFEFSIACWLYENYALVHLPWDSVWTWLIAFVLVDFTYYWFHRGAHEINFFWAFHQMHHSSEDYNFSTAIRQGMFQNYLAMFYNLPEALILPPSVHMVHLTLNKANQFWVHTQAIKTLGPLEHIFVTPSHHRVHHGRNPYCIDKNYSGTFIVWDKLFGTFQAEKAEEPVAFGLVHNVNTFDAWECQVSHFKHIFLDKLPTMTTLGDKFKAIFYGPGWWPGKSSRLGDPEDIPKVENPVQKYNPKVPLLISLYWILQLIVTNFIYIPFVARRNDMSFTEALFTSLLLLFSVQCCGAYFDKKSYAPCLESIRSFVLYYWLFNKIWPITRIFDLYCHIIVGGSAIFWTIHVIVTQLRRNGNEKKIE